MLVGRQRSPLRYRHRRLVSRQPPAQLRRRRPELRGTETGHQVGRRPVGLGEYRSVEINPEPGLEEGHDLLEVGGHLVAELLEPPSGQGVGQGLVPGGWVGHGYLKTSDGVAAMLPELTE
jgi:hypothetical protein